VEAGSVIDQQCQRSRNALQKATDCGHLDVASYLLGVHKESFEQGLWRQPGLGTYEDLIEASEEQDIEKLKELLEEPIPVPLEDGYISILDGTRVPPSEVANGVPYGAECWHADRGHWTRDNGEHKVVEDEALCTRVADKIFNDLSSFGQRVPLSYVSKVLPHTFPKLTLTCIMSYNLQALLFAWELGYDGDNMHEMRK